MQSNTVSGWRLRGVTFLLAALAAGSATFWALKLGAGRSVPALVAAADTAPTIDAQAVVRALGGGAIQNTEASAGQRSAYVLMGVLADRKQSGAALISVDGKTAKAFTVGQVVDGDWVLAAVHGRNATLSGSGGTRLELELPPLIRP